MKDELIEQYHSPSYRADIPFDAWEIVDDRRETLKTYWGDEQNPVVCRTITWQTKTPMLDPENKYLSIPSIKKGSCDFIYRGGFWSPGIKSHLLPQRFIQNQVFQMNRQTGWPAVLKSWRSLMFQSLGVKQ